MPTICDQWLIFTDLDGTLLDHDSYDFTPALPAMERLKNNSIPIIPVSSKTLAELEAYIAELGLNGPVIAENGMVIRFPDQKPEITPPDYQSIRELCLDWRRDPDFRFTGFADMTLMELVEATGLSRKSAQLAMQRLASEPILWQGDDEAFARFKERVHYAGLRLLQGGRFLHLLGEMDKGRALTRVVDWYRSKGRHKIVTLALGDSGNDIDMLLSVDIPVIIRKKDGTHLDLPRREETIISDLPGPAGWNQAINRLLNAYGK
ncbi:MAG: HAD-IIB family hydrolase [Pseudomonadota bacterium]